MLLDILALFVQIFGTLMMYFNSPINEPVGMVVTANGPDFKKLNKRNKSLKRGFAVLLTGFIIELINLLIKDSHINC
jgi:hypothetical protein